ncbi:MAG: alcohol dehydrogenase class IV [Planctomycetota bacterium]|jgi:alcohol dehydrogenase class IV
MEFRAHLPVELEFGSGKINRLGEFAARYGKRVFLVTMPDMVELGFADRAHASLTKAGLETVLFDRVQPEPKSDQIDAAAEVLRAESCDVVVGLGGGSAMDVAKAVAICAKHTGPVWDYVNLSNRPPQPVHASITLPIIAIPTTAGTGSETTPYSVVTNTETVQKGTIKEPAIFPRVAIVDPELSSRMPKALTGATGVDAFAHSLESYLNVPNRSPLSDALAETAMRGLIGNLKRAYDDGTDLEARAGVAYAASLSGMVIANAGTTVAHAIAQPLGARINTSHADSVALFTVPVLRHTLPADGERIARIGTFFPNFLGNGKSTDVAAQMAVDSIAQWLASVGITRTLADFGGGEELVDLLAEDVTTYMSRPLKQHPVQFDADDIRSIVRSVL